MPQFEYRLVHAGYAYIQISLNELGEHGFRCIHVNAIGHDEVYAICERQIVPETPVDVSRETPVPDLSKYDTETIVRAIVALESQRQ